MNSDMIPKFVKAKTPRRLQRNMQKLQTNLGMKLTFDNIGQARDGFWYAWYLIRETENA